MVLPSPIHLHPSGLVWVPTLCLPGPSWGRKMLRHLLPKLSAWERESGAVRTQKSAKAVREDCLEEEACKPSLEE